MKRNPVAYPKDVIDWWRAAERCMFCYAPVSVVLRHQGLPLQRCHIIGKGSGKRADNSRRALTIGCDRCHRCDRGPKDPDWPDLKLEHYLFVKMTEDRHFYDPDFLEHLLCRNLPRPMPLPEMFFDHRAIYVPQLAFI